MTYRAPLNDILLALNHGAGFARAAGQKKNRAYTQATLSPRTSRTPSLDHHQCSASYSGSRKKMMPTGR